MLQKNKSKSTSKFKFLIILPLMLAMLTYASCSSTKDAATQETPPPPNAVQSQVDTEPQPEIDPNGPIPFAVVEQVPVFPGCEGLETHQEQKECMTNGINSFVSKNFNTALPKELGFTGINRVYVRFMVSSEGFVTDVESRAPHPALGEEAERVVSSLPNMEPAVHRGKKVGVLYSLPITLNTPAEESTEEDKN